MIRLVMACAAIGVAVPAWAQDAPDLSANRVTVAVGAAVLPRYVGADQSILLPAVAIQGELAHHSFSTAGSSLSVDLVPDKAGTGWKLQAGPSMAVRLDRTSRVGDPQVSALGRLKTAWEPGAWVGIQRTGVVTSPYDSFSASLSWQRDVAGAYDGAFVSPSVSYGTPLSHHDYVSLSGGADHVGRRFGRYYYDIDAAGSAASSLPVYAGADRAGWRDWNLSMLAMHTLRGDLTHGVGLFATGNFARLLGPYAASPIVADVGNPRQWGGAMGIAVTF